MFKRILILSASVGNGHTTAAESLKKAFEIKGLADEVRHEDVLKFTNPLFRRLYSNAYIDLVNNLPEVLGWMYDRLDEPWKNEKRRLFFDKLNTRPFVKMVREYDPDWIVCTHFLPSEIISDLKAKGKMSTPQAIVVTDFDMHAMWLCRNYEHYFVALDETRFYLESLGCPAKKITVSGIPIDPKFSESKPKNETCAKYGLDPQLPTVMLSLGGFGVGNIETLLGPLRKIKTPVQVLAMCGKNEELKSDLEREHKDAGVRIIPVGYTRDMDEYMSASDLIVGKPGGLTTCEALAKGLVFVIANPIPGQEERNADHLLEQGAAIRSNNPATLGFKIENLLKDKKRLECMRLNALKFARPNAAFEIADRLAELGN
ncbi:MAG: UDP-N-acetylglucosamine--LPS N-acetylglucosamine transferase [Acidobacteria bacterium]|nr:MAG: UDP-N-acetylglucosamine--LPS N-acetylglucosamine transferase [Acidobacteriota bacterium]